MPHPPLVAGRFLLERPAGSGGMGTVYRALDRRSGAVVALKLLASDAEPLRARALVEADALAALDHPAIVRFIAHGLADDGRPFLAMEWLEGEDLAARLARAPLTADEAVRLGARVAAALAAAHARGVLHRDLKPSNLFLPGDDVDHAKLVDFGIARLAHAGRRLTLTGAPIGTPGYMAPEQVSGDGNLGPAVDLFALGAVLFECLAGRPAFGGTSPMALLAKVLLDEPPRLDALRADLPAALADFVAGLLAKDPTCRPTAAEAASALAALRSALEPALLSAGAPTPAATGLSGAEQRLVCVLFARTLPDEKAKDGAGAALGTEGGGTEAWGTKGGGTESGGTEGGGTENGGTEGGGTEGGATDGGASAGEKVAGPSALETTLSGDAAPRPSVAPRDALARLRALVTLLGGRAYELAGGALVAAWLGPGVPRDQAALAARAALLARERLPGVALALASGLTETVRAVPLGVAFDRAAAMLEARAGPPDAVPLDHVTAGLLDARFALRESAAGPELCGLRAPEEEEARLLLGRPVPCVGRERELRALGDLLDECVAEPVARVVLVTAPAGGGKSRLRQEFLRLVRLRGDADVWAAGADELSAGSPFVLLGAALQRAAGAGPGEPLELRHRALARRVARHVPEAERARVTAFLAEIVAAPLPAAAHPALAAARRDPALMAEQVRRAWLDLLAAETAAHPVLLVLEDLHWGDAPTLRLVGAALAELRDRPFLVLALARPEVHERFADLWAGREVQEMRLGGLTRRAAAQLVRHALPDAGEALVGRLVERADGNALYLEELVRAAAAGRADALPETITAMLQARLGTLAPEQRRLLRAASAFGEVFWPSGVQALLGADQGLTPVAEGLEALLERELLVRRAGGRFPAEPELGFRHALVRDSAYATFTEADRARAHGAAARWLEQAGEADPLVLATHYERGGPPARAAACYHRAAGISLAGNDPHGALAYAERALALGPDEALRPWVLHTAGQASWFGGRLAEAVRWTDQVLAVAPRGSGVWCLGLHTRFLVSFLSGDPELLSFGAAAVEGVEASAENAAPLIQILSMFALLFGLAGQRRLATPHLERAEALAEALGDDVDPSSLGVLYLCRSDFRLVVELDLEAALRDGEQAVRCSRAARDPANESLAHLQVSRILCHLGAFERALAEVHCAVEEAAPGAPSRCLGRAWKAMAMVGLGAREEAEREASEALVEAQAAKNRLAAADARRALAHVLQACDKPAAAERVMREGLALDVPTVIQLTDFQLALAEAMLAQGRAGEALALAREVATSHGESLRMAWLRASTVQAEALRATGEHAAARALLATCRAELLAVAARIADDELRASFLGRGTYATRLLRLAEAEGMGAGARG